MLDPSQVPNPVAGAATPSPSSDSLSGSLADKFSSAAQTAQPTPTQQPTTPTPPAPDKHTMLGKLVSHIKNAVEGRETVYTPDSNTGQIVESTQPRKPGGIFRDLVTGMLSGLAASATAGNEHPSGAAGLALGFTGAKNALDAQQDRRSALAQQSASSGFQRKQQLDQQQLAAATVAGNNLSSLNLGHFTPHYSDEEISDYNTSRNTLAKILMDNGGALAPVEGNGIKGAGPDLMKRYLADPQSVMQAPEGFHRIANITYDTQGLVHDKDTHQWTNKDGSQLDNDEWNKRGTVSLIDLPNSAWGKKVTASGIMIKDINPSSNLITDLSKNYTTDLGSMFSVGLRSIQDLEKSRKELYRVPKDANELSQWDQQRQDIQARMKSDPDSVTNDEKRFLAVKGPMIDRAKQQQAAAPVTVSSLNDARSMLDSDKPQEVSAARNFFLSSLSGPDGDKMAAFIAADSHFLPAERKIAKDWAKSYAAIKATERPEKPEKPEKPADMVIGSVGGRQVAVPFDEASNYKWDAGQRPTKAGAAEAEKVTDARSLISVFDDNDQDDPGLLQLATKLDQAGKLGPVMTRFQSWLNKGNTAANFNAGDPDVQRLFTKMGLSTTGLMQVHVGARGSAQMLEHFEDLAKAKEMSSSAFRTALDTEARYVRMKAMLPTQGGSVGSQTPPKPAKAAPGLSGKAAKYGVAPLGQ